MQNYLLASAFQQLADTYITLAARRDISEQSPVETDSVGSE